MLQQSLPFTVLKLSYISNDESGREPVATVPTVYGIETCTILDSPRCRFQVATVLTVHGIETDNP